MKNIKAVLDRLTRGRYLLLLVLLLLAVVAGSAPISLIGNQSATNGQFAIGADGQRVIRIGSVAEAAGTVDYTYGVAGADVQFQTAVNALPATGGRLVVVSTGSINWAAATSVTRAIDNVTIEGSSRGTYFVGDGLTAPFTAGGNNWVFSNIRVNVTSAVFVAAMGATTGWMWTNVATSDVYYAYRSPSGQSVLNDVTVSSLTDSGLTAGRVTMATTGGLLTDDADLTFTSNTVVATAANVTTFNTPNIVSSAGGLTLTTPIIASLYQASGGGLISVPASVGADTICLLAATQELSAKTLNASVAKGTWTASGTWTIPAVTLGGAITGSNQTIGTAASGISNIYMSGSAAWLCTAHDSYLQFWGGADANGAAIYLYGKSTVGAVGKFSLTTPNLALAATTRLEITGGADTAVTTWTATTHMFAGAASPPAPDSTVHIWNGTAGAVTAVNTSLLTLENAASNVAIQFLTANDKDAVIYAGDTESNIAGYYGYNHSVNRWYWGISGADKLFYSAGAFQFQENTTISSTGTLTLGATTLSGQLSVNSQVVDSVAQISGTNAAGAVLYITGRNQTATGAGIILETWNAAFGAYTDRLTISSAVDTAVATWSAITHTGIKITSGGSITGAGAWSIDTGGNNLLTLTGGSAGVQLGNTIGVGVAPETTSIGLFASTGTALATFRCAGDSPVIQLQRANNTLASPTDAANGNATGIISFQAYSGGWLGTASIQAYVDGTFVSGQRPPSALYFYTNLANTTAGARLGINGTGAVIVGNSGVPYATQIAGSLGVAAGVMIGANSLNNLIDDASNGAGSTTMYIGNAAIQVASDVRLKKDITLTNYNATDLLTRLTVHDFTWDDPSDISPNNRNTRGRWTGLIAQEAQPIIPFAVNKPMDDSYWQIEYQNMVPVLIKSIQELNARIAELEQAKVK